jgi:hypothetical protein
MPFLVLGVAPEDFAGGRRQRYVVVAPACGPSRNGYVAASAYKFESNRNPFS